MSNCNHIWISNGGLGGEPTFTTNQSDGLSMMIARCKVCLLRRYVDWNEWQLMTRTIDPAAASIRVCQECGELRNIRYFYRNSSRTAGGRDRTCSFCRLNLVKSKKEQLAARILTKPYSRC